MKRQAARRASQGKFSESRPGVSSSNMGEKSVDQTENIELILITLLYRFFYNAI